jgi:2-hydroxy-3-keto-5-methylthiopentenyl-1-phosphate phosphatase
MAAATDLGSKSLRDILQKKVSDKDALDRVLSSINDAYAKGTTGEQLKAVFRDAMLKEGYDISKEDSGILYGFYVP